MKRIFSSSVRQITLLLMVIAVVVVSSCSKGEYPKNLTSIPKESSLVASIDIEQLAKKADMKALKKSATFTSFSQEAFANQPALKAIVDDPGKSGVAFKQVFVFLMNGKNLGVTFALKSSSDFESTIQDVAKQENLNITIQSGSGYKYITLPQNDSATLVWDKDKALFAANTPKEAAIKLFNTPKEASIVTNKDFADFYKHKTEVAMWTNNETLYGSIGELLKNPMLLLQKELVKGTYSHYNLEFKEGEVAITTEVTPRAIAQKMNTQFLKATPNNELLKYFPEKSFMLGKASINITEIANLLAKDKEYSALLTPENLKILNSLDGDLLFSLFNFADGGLPMPQVAIAATVKDKTLYDFVVNKLLDGATKKDCGGYTAVTLQVYTFYVAQKDNILYIANSEEVVKSFAAGKPLSDNLTRSSLKGTTDSSSFFYLNLDVDSYPSSFTSLLDTFNPGAGAKFRSAMFFKDLQCTYDPSTVTGSCVLRLKETKDNSLAVILKKVDEMAGK